MLKCCDKIFEKVDIVGDCRASCAQIVQRGTAACVVLAALQHLFIYLAPVYLFTSINNQDSYCFLI